MKIEHIALYTKQLEETASFFETYFEGKRNTLYHNANTGFSSYFISFEDGTRLELMNLPELSQADNSTAVGYAYCFSGRLKRKSRQLNRQTGTRWLRGQKLSARHRGRLL